MLRGDAEDDPRAAGAGDGRPVGEEDDKMRGARCGIDLEDPAFGSERRMMGAKFGFTSRPAGLDLSNERDTAGREERSILTDEAAGARNAG